MGKHCLSFPKWRKCHNFWLLALPCFLGALWEAPNLLEAAGESPWSAKGISGWSRGGCQAPKWVAGNQEALNTSAMVWGFPSSILWFALSLWQDCCPGQDLGRWICSSESGKVKGNTAVIPPGTCLSWGDLTPFLWDIHTSLFHVNCFTKKFSKCLLERQWGLDTELLQCFGNFILMLITTPLKKHFR